MAIVLSASARAASRQIRKEPQIIVEIEGLGILFGSQPIFEFIRWDGNVDWDSGALWDSVIEKENSRNYISLSGTTQNFTQQLLADKGGTGSVSNMNIAIIDKNAEVSRLFSFDNIDEILGRKASVFLNYSQLAHPESSIPILKGYIDDFSSLAGRVDISVTHPENLKRQTLFKQYTTQLTSAIDAVQTTIPVLTTDNLITPRDVLKTYVRVGDEFMEVVSIDNDTQVTVIRSRLGSIASPFDSGEDVSSVYNISGSPIDLSLKLLLSNQNNSPFQSLEQISIIVDQDEVLGINNAIVFENYDIVANTGLVQGDSVILSNSQDNNGSYTFSFGGVLADGRSFITVNESLVAESTEGILFSYNSQFNVLSEGLGLTSSEVDVVEMVQIRDFYGAQFYDYDFFLDDTIDDMKSFIDTQLYFPQGMYSIPRKARVSCKISTPPLSIEPTPTLNTENIVNIEEIKQVRAVHKYYYNEVLYKYNFDLIKGSLLDTFVQISNESKIRIPVGNKVLKIETRGTPRVSSTTLSLGLAANRLINRYRFAAKSIKGVQIPYGVGYNLEVGDTILLGGQDTKLVDLQDGSRSGPLISYEIINKNLSITGSVKIDLLETGFGLVGRFAVFSPSSKILAGSTTELLVLGNTFECFDEPVERLKYSEIIGVKIRVRSEDYDYDELTTISSFSQVNPNAVNISPPLSVTPSEGYIVELAEYDDQGVGTVAEKVKIKYTFTSQQVSITSVTSSSVFEVSDASGIQAGTLISIHSDDYDRLSDDVKVLSVDLDELTLESALSFTPLVGDKVELLSFTDGLDNGYRLV